MVQSLLTVSLLLLLACSQASSGTSVPGAGELRGPTDAATAIVDATTQAAADATVDTLDGEGASDGANPTDGGSSNEGASPLQGPTALNCPSAGLGFAMVDAGEVGLNVACEGTGPAVLLLHGYPEFYLAWSKLIPPLVADGYRTIAPDQRGYDLSDKPSAVDAYQVNHLVQDLVGLVTATGQSKVLIVAHDWGGTVAWILAHTNPELVRGLVIIAGPHPDIWGHPSVDPTQAQAENSYVPFLAGPLGETAFGLYDDLLSPYLSSDELAAYHTAWNQPNAEVSMDNWYRANLYPDASMPTGVLVDTPTLVLWGTGDSFATPSELPLLPNYVSHLTVVTWPDAGHFIDLEMGAALAPRIAAFERSLPP